MKSKYLVAVLASMLVGTVQAAVVTQWSFEGNANDTAAGGTVADNLAAAPGGVGITYAPGIVGQAGDFVNNSDMQTPASADVSLTGNFAVDMFIKDEGSASQAFARLLLQWGTATDVNAYHIALNAGQLSLFYNGNVNPFNAGPDLRDNQWHYVAISNDSADGTSGLKAWVDDANVFTGPGISINNSTTGVSVGSNAGNFVTAYAFTGLIDEVLIHDSPIDQTYVDGRVALMVPEPATMAMLGLGLGGLVFLRRRRS